MIAALTGKLDSIGPDRAVIDVGGVGYLVFASAKTLARLPRQGEGIKLLIETHVREDHIHLYGFLEAAERDWFRLLLSVQGVGARVALAIQSVLTPDELATAIAAQDKAAIVRAEGVGPKLAQRIVSELKDKAGELALGAVPAGRSADAGEAMPAGGVGTPTGDAVSALVNLGYGRSEAFGAVNAAAKSLGGAASTEALITAGLKELAQ